MGGKKSQKVKGWKGHGEEMDPDMKGGERVEFFRFCLPSRWNGKQIGDWGKCGSQDF